MSDQRSLVTVVGSRKRVDVALPAGAPVGEYAARLADLCGQDSHDVFPPAWSLAPASGGPLALEHSLADAGVVDGAVLYLVDIAGDPGGEPAIEDIEELVADETAGYRRREPPRGLIVIALSLAWLAASGLVLLRLHPGITAAISLTGTALVLLGISWAVRQRRSAVPPALCLVMSLTSALCMAVAGLLLMSMLDGGLWWVGLIVGAHVGVVMALATTPEIILFAIELQLLVGTLLLPLFLTLRVTGAEAAAAVTVAAVALLAGAKWIAASISAWASRPPKPKAGAPMAQAVTVLLVRARRVLTVVIAGPILALAVTLPVLAFSGSWWGLTLAAVASTGLLIRTKQAGFGSEAVTLGAGGFVGLFAVLGALAGRLGGPDVTAIALPAGGLLVLGTGLLLTLVQLPLSDATRDVSLGGAAAAGRRSVVDVVGMLCGLAVAPLAMGVYGVFSELSAMGRGLVD
ncbi:EsaB/YukD family protein [Plantactinospora sp. WMMB334]|uniref:EsaB/YukD family protein n=1 Tax=Plantactinospora sp. WMMB334 TaxID=3404119 RepID=UPI003B92D3F2